MTGSSTHISVLRHCFAWMLLTLAFASYAEPTVVRVVTDNNYPPYVVTGSDGLAEGYVVDLWKLWERKTGVPVEFKAMQWSEAQRALRDQQADVIDMIFRTPVREQLYDYSKPYATLPVSIYVDSSIHGVHDIRSLSGFSIGVQRGDACVDMLTNQGVSSLVAYPNYEEILAAGKAGQIKMFCMDDDPANYYLYLHRDKVDFTRAFKLYEGQFHWAVNKGDVATFDLVNRGMNLITTEERAALREKWFNHPFAFRPYLRIVLMILLAALGVVSAAGFWIWTLRRSVSNRTAEIQHKHQQLEAVARELRVEKALLRAIIESSPDAMLLKSPEGVYLDCNAGALALSQMTREHILGKTDQELFPDERFVHFVRSSDREVLRSGKPLQYETSVAAPDGSVHDIEVFKALVNDVHGAPAGVLTVVRDITERRLAERELRIASVAFESHDGMIIANAQGIIERVNSAFTRISGYLPHEAIGQSHRLLQSGLHPRKFYKQQWHDLRRDGYWHGEIVNQHRDGHLYTARLSISKVTDAEGKSMHYIGHLQDITAEKAAHALAEHLRLFDPLTDLPNRQLIEARMTHALAKTRELHTFGALMMINLDFFQKVNDTLGHGIGDRLLTEMAQRIRSLSRDGDTVGRFSGDSFVLIAENIGANLAEATSRSQELAETIRQRVKVPVMFEEHRLACTASIGVTLFCERQTSTDVMLRQAELAMYRSKTTGRDTVRLFEDSMQAEIDRRSWLENDLREAIERQQFVLYYQLQVDVHGKPIGAEALLRWNHPTRGLVPPADFIPLAEETGLIEAIGGWALAAACRQLALWACQPEMRQLTIAVNISPRQFKSAHFVEDIVAEVQSTGASANKLKLEVTESMAIDDFADSLAKLQALRASGFRISLDDFGTGNSSLNYLTKLPLTQLKIDKSFVDDLPNSHRDAMVAQTIIAMGRGLELDVIAEGVESEAQYRFLVGLGCQAFQGYFFGRPQPVDAFEASLKATPTHEAPP